MTDPAAIYFFDTEFIERGHQYPIDLISIGVISMDNRQFYAINKDCDFTKASPWVCEHVLDPIGIHVKDDTVQIEPHAEFYMRGREELAARLLWFLKKPFVQHATTAEDWFPVDLVDFFLKDAPTPLLEFWGAWSCTDWVILYQLFGAMVESPKGFPWEAYSVTQWAHQAGIPREKLPPDPENQHQALEDARWVKQAYEYLQANSRIVKI